MTTYTAIGLMSGTSVDGVDAALLRTDGQNDVQPLAFFERPYSDEERACICNALGLSVRDDPRVIKAEEVITQTHIKAVRGLLKQEGIEASSVDVIGFHGQTIFHNPTDKITIQIGDAKALADSTGINVVYDFRSADVAAGGEGAPLLPLYHQARIAAGEVNKPVAVLNLGGVGNITWIGAGNNILAFDTGPANALMDDFIKSRTGQAFDKDGAYARAGRANTTLIEKALAHDYFKKAPPKSLDRDAFSDVLAGINTLSLEDGLATLAAITVQTVIRGFSFLTEKPEAIFVTGGGRRNSFLMEQLAKTLHVSVLPVESLGWNGDALEAEGFAYLAVRSLQGLSLSVPTTTGVPEDLTGGRLYSVK